MATKLIENIDENTWNKFSGYCKIKGVLMGEELSDILEEHLKEWGRG